MASIGLVNAETPRIQDPMKTQNRPIKLYFGVFFDGTNNNMIQKDTAQKFRNQNAKAGDMWEAELALANDDTFKNGANQPHVEGYGYSNVALLHSVYQAKSAESLEEDREKYDVSVYNIYVEGAGTDTRTDSEPWYSGASDIKGNAFGKGIYGVCMLVAKAVNMVRQRLKAIPKDRIPNTEIHFDVFGFSRGATCARLFSFLALRNSGQRLTCENEFKKSAAAAYFSNGFLHFLDTLKLKDKTIDFLGIYDTVSSIGGTSIDSYANNVTEYGLYSPNNAKVLNTFHLCAMDEFRSHFALTDIGSAANNSGNAELFIPGCHSDVGGSYVTGSNNFDLVEGNAKVRCTFAADHIERPSLHTKQVNPQTMLDMGWVSSKSQCRQTYDETVMTVSRQVICGYSNIPLAMMRIRAGMKTDRRVFREIPLGYSIDTKRFGEWSKALLILAKSAKGRSWYYPGGSYNSDSYVRLRQYLHFSSTNSAIMGIVFSPSYHNYQLCRYVYRGNQGDNIRRFMDQYYSH